MDTCIKKCEFCGKPFEIKSYTVADITKKVQVAQCNCYEEIEKKNQEEKEKEEKRKILEKKFQNSLITPFFPYLLFIFSSHSK